MVGPFIGSEAIRAGLVRKHELRSRYAAVFPDVYLRRDVVPSPRQRAEAGWLWTRRAGIVAGLTAAGLHGAKWIDEAEPVELIWSNARPPQGLRTQQLRVNPGERMILAGLPVTTPQRTAFDIGRRGSTRSTVARMDALLRATGISVEEVQAVAARHRGARGLRQLETVLSRVDAGAQSPKESWLRLILVDAGLPRPRTQIPVRSTDGWSTYYLDMGWEDIKVAVEYDGDHHRTDRVQFAKDVHRLEDLQRLGWIVVRVLAGDAPPDIVRRVHNAIARRAPSLRTDHENA